MEILRMDKNSIELYKRALSEGKDAVHNIRVMVVGHYGVGKTTLTKRLFGEDVDINERKSTDGIEVHVKRCKVSLETGQWVISKRGQKIEKASHRLVKLLMQTTSMTETNTLESNEHGVSAEEEEIDNVDDDILIEDNDIATDPKLKESCENDSKWVPSADISINVRRESNKNTQQKDEIMQNHLKNWMEDVMQKPDSDDDTKMADVSFWDFAGQYVFYGTHRMFLSRRAVYLLVTDISKLLHDICKDDECVVDSEGPKNWKISEFVDFWLNSIHEFCSSQEDNGPPVLLVGTFADIVNQESRQETVDNFFYTLRRSLVNKATKSHLTEKDFVIDNSIEDENIGSLREQIINVASSQPYWGELIPAKWITLEYIIVQLKDEGAKVLHTDKLHDLNNTLPVPIETEDELELFLKFHHESGNFLYYSDAKLCETIVLDPQWLIDAFKSLISAKMFCCRNMNLDVFEIWLKFVQSAILSRKLVDAVWIQEKYSVFRDHTDLLLGYLERLGFISKPHKQPDETEEIINYYAPCMLKTVPPEELLKSSTDRRSSSVLCFKTSSNFLPTAVFNKLLASCIAKWPIAKLRGTFLLFCGCGVFDLKYNHKLYLYFFNHIINVWITKLSTKDIEPDMSLCRTVYEFISEFLKQGICLSSGFEVVFRCNHADLHNTDNIIKLEDIISKEEVVCNSESGNHCHETKKLTKYWLCDDNAAYVINEKEFTEKELNIMAHHIGKEYHSLGLELGLSQAELDRINLDNTYAIDRIRNMLIQWNEKNKTNATVDVLRAAMNRVGIDAVTVIKIAKGNI